jgi:hypothetical protein
MNYASETPVQTTFVARFNLAMLMAWGLWLVLLIAYVLPWVLHSTSSMTLNAYDLAEWTTLSPAQRQISPALPVALGLRLQLPILVALGVILLRASRQGFFALGLVILGALVQFPPLEFIGQWQDVNYQQQAMLVVVTLMVSGLLWWVFGGRRWRLFSVLLLSILGLVSSYLGWQGAIAIMEPFGLVMSVGLGYIAMLIGYVGFIVWALASLTILSEQA